jgi:DNA-binding HxlR family transcriptional regulator
MIHGVHRKAPSRCLHFPVARFQKILNGKYKLTILWDLQEGPRRFGEIRKRLLRGAAGLELVAPRVLSRELKTLTQFGLIQRKAYQVVPPKVEYRLTPLGRSLLPVIAAMQQWGTRHLTRDVYVTKTEPVLELANVSVGLDTRKFENSLKPSA